MHLVSLRRQTIHIRAADVSFTLEEGETIWTESSYKYEAHQIVDAAERTGFERNAQWVDAENGFALTLVTAV
jgi:uncharacterized SAM-dependent methyltransferase